MRKLMVAVLFILITAPAMAAGEPMNEDQKTLYAIGVIIARQLDVLNLSAEELGFVEDIEAVEELAPDAEPEDMAEVLKSLRHDQVMLVGHQPHLGQLAALLITGETRGRVGIKKGGLVRIDIDDWREDPPGQIRWLLTVKQLSWMKKKQKKAGDDAGGSEE